MESREVRIRVDLETEDAAQKLDKPDRPQPENPGGGPAVPGVPAPDAGAGQGRTQNESNPGGPPAPAPVSDTPVPGAPGGAGRDVPSGRGGVREEELEQRVTDRIRQELGQAASTATGGGGRLSDQAVGLAAAGLGAIPVVGGALAGGVRVAEFSERYGAAALTGAAEAMAQVNPQFAEGLKRIAEVAEEGTRFTAGVRARLDAVGAAFEETRTLAGGIALAGGEADPRALAAFGTARYGVLRTMLEAESNRRLMGLEALGAAGGQLLGNLMNSALGDVGR